MSVPFGVAELVRWTAGRLVQGSEETRFASVSTDTRSLPPGALFVAIRGERHDAHDHLAAAIAAGAGGLLVERPETAPVQGAPALPVVAVADTTRALGALAAGHRAAFEGPLVAITGSNGKTSTKELCAAILERRGPCLRNRGNWNNAYGLPLTLLEREASHQSAVVELGTNHPGEIGGLAAIARPDVGVLTNVGTAHIEFLGSREGIAREKGALLEALPDAGLAVLNADDPLVMSQAGRSKAPVRTFGLGGDAEVRAEQVEGRGAAGFGFRLCAPEGSVDVRVGGLGDHAVANALAAAAAALGAGASLDDVRGGLAAAVQGRMQPVELRDGVVLIDDTYNASPQSLESALHSLARLKGNARGLLVLGDMGELGDHAPAAHRAAGELAARLGLDALIAQGELAGEVVRGATDAGMDPARACVSTSHEETTRQLSDRLRENDWVLVKGSRAMHMERVVAGLREAEGS